MKLPREERETTISFNEEGELAFVWSASPKFHRMMAKLGLEFYSTKLTEGAGEGRYYNVPKSYIKIKLPHKTPNLTPEQRAARAEATRVRFTKRSTQQLGGKKIT